MHQMKDNFVIFCLLLSSLFCIDIKYLGVLGLVETIFWTTITRKTKNMESLGLVKDFLRFFSSHPSLIAQYSVDLCHFSCFLVVDSMCHELSEYVWLWGSVEHRK